MKSKHAHRHDGNYSFDFCAHSSKIIGVSPTLKILLSFFVLMICIFADNIFISLSVIVSMSYITVFKGGAGMRDYILALKIPIAFMIPAGIAAAADLSAIPCDGISLYVGFGYVNFEYDGVIEALKIMLKSTAAISAVYMTTLSTPMNEIISVLRKFHIPKLIIELMTLIYRFIFILADVYRKMRVSAEARLGYDGFIKSCRSFGNIAGNLFVVSLKKANAYYNSMLSRCYDGELLFLEEEKKAQAGQIAAAVLYSASLILIWILTG